jgi:signal peptide peptidase SppA
MSQFYARILNEFYGHAWAVPEDQLLRMHQLLSVQASGVKFSDPEIMDRITEANVQSGYIARQHFAASPRRSQNSGGGKVAVIPIVGVISHRASMIAEISGPGAGTSIQKLQEKFRVAVDDPDCRAIVLDVDSPGGSVEGVMELASEIYDARKQKPITAVCNAMACSAAYWLAAAAGEVVITPSGQCGSIGVYMLHQDESEALAKDGIKISVIKAGKYKAEGNPSEPLSPEAREAFQGKVDAYYTMFVKAIGQYRGASQAAVREGYGQGRSLLASDAVRQNLADRIGTFDDVLGEALGRRRIGSTAAAVAMPYGARFLGKSARPEDDQDEDACACDCVACQGCTNRESESKSRADARCDCKCVACTGCAYKSGNVARSHYRPSLQQRQRELDIAAGSMSPAPSYKASLRRRQRELDIS